MLLVIIMSLYAIWQKLRYCAHKLMTLGLDQTQLVDFFHQALGHFFGTALQPEALAGLVAHQQIRHFYPSFPSWTWERNYGPSLAWAN